MCLSMETNLFNLHMNMGLQLSSLWTRLNSIFFLIQAQFSPLDPNSYQPGILKTTQILPFLCDPSPPFVEEVVPLSNSKSIRSSKSKKWRENIVGPWFFCFFFTCKSISPLVKIFSSLIPYHGFLYSPILSLYLLFALILENPFVIYWCWYRNSLVGSWFWCVIYHLEN